MISILIITIIVLITHDEDRRDDMEDIIYLTPDMINETILV